MSALPLEDLERALILRNALLKGRLRPGLPGAHIRRALMRAKITGPVDLLVALYAWRDGTNIDPKLALSKTGFFPGRAYVFINLQRALGQLGFFKAAAKNYPKMAEAVGRYFPFFWDGSGKWIALDLHTSGAIVTIDMDAEPPFRQVYDSMGEFVADMIRANEQNTPLACFQAGTEQ